MNIRSLRLYAIVLLGTEYLLLGAFALFFLAGPVLASQIETTTPGPQILWAKVHVPKPTPVPVEIVVPTSTPETIDIVDNGSSELENPAVEDQAQAEGRWIDVNLSEQQMYAYEGNILVNSFIVSTGLPGTPTVTGTYQIYVKVPMQDMSGPGYYLPDVPWVMFFYDDYGFHGTYWHNNFGTPMSRGCVNLRIEDAEWLYYWASVGTTVNIHY